MTTHSESNSLISDNVALLRPPASAFSACSGRSDVAASSRSRRPGRQVVAPGRWWQTVVVGRARATRARSGAARVHLHRFEAT